MNRVEMKKKLMAAGLSAMITVGTVAPALVGGLAGTPMASNAVFGTGGQPAAAASFPAFGAAAVFGTGGTPAAATSINVFPVTPAMASSLCTFAMGGVPAGASIVCTFAMGGVPAGA